MIFSPRGRRLGPPLPRSRCRSSLGFSCTYRSPSARGRSSCSACWPRWGCRASPPALTSRAVPSSPGGGSFSGPSSTGTSSFGGGSLLRGSTRGGVDCRLRCTPCLSARPDVLCFRVLPKRRSGVSASKLECTGAIARSRRTASFLRLE